METFLKEFMPVTASISFLRCPAARLSRAFRLWRLALCTPTSVKRVDHGIRSMLPSLWPLEPRESRILIVEASGGWTALFTNNAFVGDGGIASVVAGLTLSEAVLIRLAPENYETRSKEGGRKGGVREFQHFAPRSRTDCLPKRVFRASQNEENDRWSTFEKGEPLPFEPDCGLDEARREKFPTSYMSRCCERLGIEFEREEFYGARGLIVRKLSLFGK